MQFLYGNHVLKSGLGRITEATAAYTGVVVYSMADVPLGFGVAAKSTQVRQSSATPRVQNFTPPPTLDLLNLVQTLDHKPGQAQFGQANIRMHSCSYAFSRTLLSTATD